MNCIRFTVHNGCGVKEHRVTFSSDFYFRAFASIRYDGLSTVLGAGEPMSSFRETPRLLMVQIYSGKMGLNDRRIQLDAHMKFQGYRKQFNLRASRTIAADRCLDELTNLGWSPIVRNRKGYSNRHEAPKVDAFEPQSSWLSVILTDGSFKA